ncbi:hypothetical protein [Paraburkholderia dipogonis]|uniref:hypothetical protein n=1 Tax=Paraburkholderia dipogonis TaxID=1211383 RepID=UPI0038BB55CC
MDSAEESVGLARKTLQSTFAGGSKNGKAGFKRLIAKPIRRADARRAGGRITG